MRHSEVLAPPPPHESSVKRSPLSGSIERGSAQGMVAIVWITLALEGSSCNTAPVVKSPVVALRAANRLPLLSNTRPASEGPTVPTNVPLFATPPPGGILYRFPLTRSATNKFPDGSKAMPYGPGHPLYSIPPKKKLWERNPVTYGTATNPGAAISVLEHPGSGASLKVTVPVCGNGRLPSVTSTAE